MKVHLLTIVLLGTCMGLPSLAGPLREKREAKATAVLQTIRNLLGIYYDRASEVQQSAPTSQPPNATRKGECTIVDNNMRINCGYVESEAQCGEMKCCWLLSDIHGVPWCYHKQEIKPQCQTNDRVQCGRYDINAVECESRGCCWSPLAINRQPWCYHETATEPQCQTEAIDREECRYSGITPEQCKADGCCWSPTNVRGTPWCFNITSTAKSSYFMNQQFLHN